MAGKRFINGIVYHLKNHVVQTGTIRGIPYLHPWTLANCIQSLKNFDAGRIVISHFLVSRETSI
jgi:hypothetical protein